MDCLHCGKPLTLLKKLGDSRFCSADHERAWKQAIQETMLERLRMSSEQFRRVVQRARAAVVPPEPEPEIVEAAPPPRLAGFVLSRPEPVEPVLEPLIRQVVAPADLGVALPSGPPLVSARSASQSSPLSTDAPFVVPVDSTLVVAAQSS